VAIDAAFSAARFSYAEPMSSNWVPMDEDPTDYGTLHEGIPAWIAPQLWNWISVVTNATDPRSHTFTSTFQRMDLALRFSSSLYEHVTSMHGLGMIRNNFSAPDIFKIVDFLVADNDSHDRAVQNRHLEELLRDGGSAWRVGTRAGHAGLERRVPVGVQEAAEHIMDSSELAGRILSEAWHAAFGHNPDPEKAYKKAIVAVEEAAAEKVIPNNKTATLGSILKAMKDQKNWSLPLLENPAVPSKDVAIQMAQALWSGETGRHGGNGYRASNQEEAEAAVLLAVPLVYFFTRETVARRD